MNGAKIDNHVLSHERNFKLVNLIVKKNFDQETNDVLKTVRIAIHNEVIRAKHQIVLKITFL